MKKLRHTEIKNLAPSQYIVELDLNPGSSALELMPSLPSFSLIGCFEEAPWCQALHWVQGLQRRTGWGPSLTWDRHINKWSLDGNPSFLVQEGD